jgi:hypothetical protein
MYRCECLECASRSEGRPLITERDNEVFWETCWTGNEELGKQFRMLNIEEHVTANFISVCSILLRINTNIIINECPLSQHCFNIRSIILKLYHCSTSPYGDVEQ